MGLVDAGQGFVSLGTSGVVFLGRDAFHPRPESALHAFCHALPATWHQMSVMLSAASALRWLGQVLGQHDPAALVARMAALPQAERSSAPLFLPYLSGERTPHNDPSVRASFHGLDHGHEAAHLAYAVVEGVSFGLRDGWEAFGVAREHARELALAGGGARSAEWAQLLADVLQVPLVRGVGTEVGGALGAARLAWLACGADAVDVCVGPSGAERFDPEPDRSHDLQQRYERFKALYPRATRGLGSKAPDRQRSNSETSDGG
jgi:xylulokinase